MNDNEPLNIRHERVVQAIARGESHRDAYMAEYPRARPEGADASVARLLGNARVQARLEELLAAARTQAAEDHGVDLDWLLREGKDLYKLARDAKEYQAAGATLERLAKISGNWVDQSHVENDGVQRIYSSAPLSEEQWRNQHAPKPVKQQAR